MKIQTFMRSPDRLVDRPAIPAVAAGALVLVLVGYCSSWRANEARLSIPVVAQETSASAATPSRPIETRLSVKATDKKQRKRLGKKYHRDLEKPALVSTGGRLFSEEVLKEVKIDWSNCHAEALITETEHGETVVTVKPAPRPFVSFRPAWEAGAMLGRDTDRMAVWRAWTAVEPFRAGSVHARVEVGAEHFMGRTYGYAMAGAVWRAGGDGG